LDRRLSGPHSWAGRGGEKKKSHPLPGLEPPIIQPIAQGYVTEIFRLLCITPLAKSLYPAIIYYYYYYY
jgi:hypothetical protein